MDTHVRAEGIPMDNNLNTIVAKVLGVVFLLIGIVGFVNNPIVGLFGVNLLHNLVHLVSGGILLAVGFLNQGQYARVTNQVFGVVYLLVALLGFLAPSIMNPLLGMNVGSPMADNVLHLLLAVAFLGVGFGIRAPSGPGTIRRA